MDLYFSTIANNYYQKYFWQDIRKESASGGRFMIDLSLKYNPNRFIARDGEWSLPWKQQVPEIYSMPKYDPDFNKSFSEITDQRADQIKELIKKENQYFALMYSGGIDSTLALSSLIKNLNQEELEHITVCANKQSINENPIFWNEFIWNKFKIINSSKVKYDDLIDLGYRPITADEGDCIFGTVFGLEFYQNYDYYLEQVSSESKIRLENLKKEFNTAHYSEYKDVLLLHFKLEDKSKNDYVTVIDPKFAELWYEKTVKNIQTSSVPIHTIHDFFWWQIFNLKYISCAIRSSVFLNDRKHVGDVIKNHVINWYNTEDYQKWSMVNNNNGEKIKSMGSSTYKIAAKKYIYELDKNPWYFYFKLKLPSLGSSVVIHQDLSSLDIDQRPNARFGLDQNYNTLYLKDPTVVDFIKESMTNYLVDW